MLHFSRDIVVDVELAHIRTNTITAIETGAVMISFMPNEEDCRRDYDHRADEFLFVIDCSGSMAEANKIGLTSKAMLLFLKSLPVGCRFNIIRFGSNFASLFNNQVTEEYNDENMRQAELLIKCMEADMGGTELMKPLRWLAKSKPPPGVARQIFLLTDGEVSNVHEVIDLCRDMAAFTRIFSFGLGHSVNDRLSPKIYIRNSACLF